VVANFAFLTRSFLANLDPAVFSDINSRLTRQFLYALDLPSVRVALTVSSGAVLDPEDTYGQLKAFEEASTLSRASSTKTVVVARAYSVSGPYVRTPTAYAFSHFILQALDGSIRISADRPVYRRYTSVSDLLTVALLKAQQGWSGVLESGGDLVELETLAQVVRREVNPAAEVSRVPLATREPQVYASNNSIWQSACTTVGFKPQGLRSQVRSVRDYLLST
jgi:nucleoside-diphosphate-sugar epimerase